MKYRGCRASDRDAIGTADRPVEWTAGPIGGCDKNMPGAMMAIARCNVPAVFVYGGKVKRAVQGQGRRRVGMRGARRFTAGPDEHEEDFKQIEKRCIPGSGRGRHVPANHDELLVLGARHEPDVFVDHGQPDGDKLDSTTDRPACDEAVEQNMKPLTFITQRVIENAISLVMGWVARPNAVAALSEPSRGRQRG